MLKDTSELAEDTISKNPIISKVFLKKILKFLPRYQIFGLRAMFLLVLLLDYCSAKKRGGKPDPIWPIAPDRMLLILLTKTIVI